MKSKIKLLYLIIAAISLSSILYIWNAPLEIPKEDVGNQQRLNEFYREKKYSHIIHYADSLLKNKDYKDSYITFYRGAAYYKLKEYDKSLADIDYTINKNGKGDYFLYYMRAILYEQLLILDTSRICFDISQAINSKGSLIVAENLELDYVDSTDLFDVNYIDMLNFRVKYCSELMPSYTVVDRELIHKNK